MAMTEEERKEARRLAAKKWYETHKKAKHAVKAAKPDKAVRKAARKTAKPDKAKSEIEKRVAKLASKGDKAVASMKALIKDAAAVATDVHKTGDEKLIDSVMSKLMRSLSLGISPAENGKGVLSSTLQAAYRVPKVKTPEPAVQGPDVSEDETKPVEIPVGDAGDVEAASDAEILEASDSEAYDEDSDPDDPEKSESDPFVEMVADEDDEDDEEKAEDDERAYVRGREDMFREMAEMGFGEEDE